MNNVNKTLYIPLYDKAYVSKKGIILEDKKAEMTPGTLVNALGGCERYIFRRLYAGKTAKRLYRLYEYKSV